MTSTLAVAKLGDIADVNPRLTDTIAADAWVSFVPMAAVSAETAQVEVVEERRFGEVSKGYTPFCKGDVLIAKITPCFENGKIAQATLRHHVGFGSTEFHVVRPKVGKVDARYLLHYLRQSHIRRAGEQRMTGSGGQRRVPASFIANLSVPLPSLAEQRRVAEVLDLAKVLQTRHRVALVCLDKLQQAIFIDLFGDPLSNAKSWPCEKLEALGTLDRGVSKHRPRNAPELLGGPYPLVQTGEVANCDGYIRRYNATYSEFGLKQSKLWPAGTLCITIAANIAKTGILTFDACFPDSVVGFRAENMATVEYVRIWLSFLQKTLEDNAPESAQKNINLAILRNLEIPVPSLPLLHEFARRVNGIEQLKDTHHKSLAALDQLFASLTHRAFYGEL